MIAPPVAELLPPRRRPLGFEMVLVVLVAAAILVPGIWKYTLVDPWETHYGEVAREMLQNNDFVHTQWYGTSSGNPTDNEGFRSKPVFIFWMMAAGMQSVGVGDRGGYSGEMVSGPLVMLGVRLPFVLAAIGGLVLLWWMLARLVSRRLAWLALLVVGSVPMFCMISRNAIPDMPLTACTIGALSLFTMAVEDGDRAVTRVASLFRNRVHLDARHVVLAIALGFVGLQALYYLIYFASGPYLGVRGPIPNPAVWLPLGMALLAFGLARDGWMIVRLPLVLLGGIIAAIVNEPMPVRRQGQSRWRHLFDDILAPWERHSIDRYVVRGLAFLVVYPTGGRWADTQAVADRVLGMQPITQMRQVYLLGCYFLLGVSLLVKGPPGLTVVAGVGAFHVILLARWRALYEGTFEIKRGLLLMIVVAVPWHVAMYLKEGPRFFNEYIGTHVLDRAGAGVDNSPGTFAYYTEVLGPGLYLWAGLLPAALVYSITRASHVTREGRVRFMMTLWAIVAVALFCLVSTKFHHYLLPAMPPLAVLVAFLLDDLLGRRERLHPLFAALGVGIVLLICRDMMFEPDRWIELFVFRYDRPWPSADPWQIDPSDGFLALGLAGAIGIALLATRAVRLGVGIVGGVGLAVCVWCLQIYMPLAARHWGMGDAVRTYYQQRTVYGQKLVYFSPQQLAADWADVKDRWSFETFVPATLQIGQPMTITVQLNKVEDERVMEQQVELVGTATALGDHEVTVTLAPGQRAKLDPLVARARTAKPPRRRLRLPIRAVDADRLLAWQLYWRGENFWSGGEIWHWLPEMKTSFVSPNNQELTKYLGDRTRAPYGRRYFVITEAGRINGMRSQLPGPRSKDSYEILDTTSNKFSLGAFYLWP